MSSIATGARKLVRRGTDLPTRIEGLRAAAEAARGRVDDEPVDSALAVVERAGRRLALSGEHTVVALAGATGSGKSSTFNALAGLELARTGVRRPTTSATMACVWGADGAGELMDWVGVPHRHQVTRDSLLDDSRPDRDLEGLVLLDLPDHDSTEVAHHVEVDRVVQLADLMVWVLDPQKYADAAVHQRYLRPLASHREILLVTLNHIDEVPPDHRPGMVADLERLLVADGLAGVPVLATSARDGLGIADLRAAVSERVTAKRATRARLEADVTAAAERLDAASGRAAPGDLGRDRRAELVDAFADAAGVPTVVRAVEQSTRRRAASATGWPVTSWLSRLKPDPLRRLHLDLGQRGKELTGQARASVPVASPVQRARVDAAVRRAADTVAAPLSAPWAGSVRRASLSRLDDLGDALDRAVTGTDLGTGRTPVWWRVVQLLQWFIVAGALLGGVWLAALAVVGYLQLPSFRTPSYEGVPLPTALLLGGVAAGVLLAMLCRVLVRWSARRRARAADRRLRAAIETVTDDLVVEPLRAEVAAYQATRDGLAAALHR